MALIPEFRQARVEDGSGAQYALTRRTTGIELATLQVGQCVRCCVRGIVVLTATVFSADSEAAAND